MSPTIEPRIACIAVDLATAAVMSSLSKRTIQNYIRTRRLRAMKIGKRTVILVRDLEVFLQDGQPSVETLEQAIKAEQELSEARRRLLASNESMMGLDN